MYSTIPTVKNLKNHSQKVNRGNKNKTLKITWLIQKARKKKKEQRIKEANKNQMARWWIQFNYTN